MSELRRASTRRLLAACAAILAVFVVGVAVAGAIGTGGSPPPPKPLPEAVHGALTAPAPVGISARVKFTSRLLGDSLVDERTSPLLKGGTGRLWVAEGGKLRLELQSDRGDSQVVSDGRRFLLTDPSSKTVYTGTLPQHRERRAQRQRTPSLSKVKKGLGRLERFARVLGPGREVVAGRPAYSVRVEPLHNRGLLGGIGAAWDAIRGVPLRFAVYAKGVSAPVIELAATDVTYGPISASTFAVSPPKNARIHRVGASAHHAAKRRHARVEGAAAVRKALPFRLDAPGDLAGEKRTEVHLIDSRRSPAAVVAYGKPLLGGLVVLEHAVDKKSGERGSAASKLPHVKIGSVDATVVSTALGTVVSFDRGGVHYTVAGPVDRAQAEAAARGL